MFTVEIRYFQFLIQTFWNTNNQMASYFTIMFPVLAFLSDNFKIMLWFLSCAITFKWQTVWCWIFWLWRCVSTYWLYFSIIQSLYNRQENLLVFLLSGWMLTCLILLWLSLGSSFILQLMDTPVPGPHQDSSQFQMATVWGKLFWPSPHHHLQAPRWSTAASQTSESSPHRVERASCRWWATSSWTCDLTRSQKSVLLLFSLELLFKVQICVY